MSNAESRSFCDLVDFDERKCAEVERNLGKTKGVTLVMRLRRLIGTMVIAAVADGVRV